MNTPELPDSSAAPAAATVESLQQSVQSLQSAITVTLVALVLLSGSLNLFLFRQHVLARRQLEENVPVVEKMVAEYQAKTLPLINYLVTNLQTFTKSNPDFAPILVKYVGPGNVQATAPASVPPAQVPAPVVPAAPKKK